jgi:3-oxoadipate enol-lactonase
LVLLHGWTSSAALNYFRCFEVLSREFRVVALDHRGHGRGIRSRRPFRLEDCADDAAALAGALGTGPVTVVGYSMGGPVAQLLWRRHPETVRGLVLCATATRFAPPRTYPTPVDLIGSGAAFALAGVPAPVRSRGYEMLVRNRLNGTGVADWAVVEWQRHDPAALLQAGMALSRFDSSGWIGEIDVPTSVIITELDLTVPPTRQRQLASAIPGAVTYRVAGGHRACADQPDLFVPTLVRACQVATRQPVRD